MGHADAEQLVSSISDALHGLSLRKVQVSMDGPAVNWKFHEMFASQLDKDCKHQILEIGSCGLHILHGAFVTAVNKTGWDIDNFIFCLYVLFKDSPVRRGDYQIVTRCKTSPMKFCKHRWLENVPVMQRVLEIIEPLKHE